jgi:ATP-dependent protease ClpP protease subunit
MRETADMLDKVGRNIASIYAARCGGDVEDWREAMLDETWYSPQEAVDAGLADDIIMPTTLTASTLPHRTGMEPSASIHRLNSE